MTIQEQTIVNGLLKVQADKTKKRLKDFINDLLALLCVPIFVFEMFLIMCLIKGI
jgi:hypothetical protein